MNDERKNQGMERRDYTGPDTNKPEKSFSFVRDGIEIFNYKNPATIVTFGIVGFVLAIITFTLLVDRRGRSEIEKIVIQTVPNVKLDDDGPTMRKKFRELDETNIYTKIQLDQCKNLEPRLKYLESFQEAPRRKR